MTFKEYDEALKEIWGASHFTQPDIDEARFELMEEAIISLLKANDEK